jgi:FMN phosphatase YigB (HAD superfamily)
MPLRLMLFDLWGTLIVGDGDGLNERRMELRLDMAEAAFARLDLAYSRDRISEAFDAAGAALSAVHAEQRDLTTEGRTILYLQHLDEGLAERLSDEGWRIMHEAILTPGLHVRPNVYPDAAGVLADVKSLGVATGLISNAGVTPGFVLRDVMRGHGLLEHIDHAIFSDEVELSKPATAIFQMALDEFGVEPDEAAFVGDQPILDVLGPQSAGIRSIQVGDVRADGIEPDARISTLSELIPALRSLQMLD